MKKDTLVMSGYWLLANGTVMTTVFNKELCCASSTYIDDNGEIVMGSVSMGINVTPKMTFEEYNNAITLDHLKLVTELTKDQARDIVAHSQNCIENDDDWQSWVEDEYPADTLARSGQMKVSIDKYSCSNYLRAAQSWRRSKGYSNDKVSIAKYAEILGIDFGILSEYIESVFLDGKSEYETVASEIVKAKYL